MSQPSTSAAERSQRGFSAAYLECASALQIWARLQVRGAIAERISPEDIIQETWCRALLAFPRFDPRRGGFRAFLFGIAEKVLLEELRRLPRRPRGHRSSVSGLPGAELAAEITSISERASRSEFVTRLLDAASALSAEERQLLLWRGVEERSFEELGARLSQGAEAVRSRWRRLRTRLQQSLQDFGDQLPGG